MNKWVTFWGTWDFGPGIYYACQWWKQAYYKAWRNRHFGHGECYLVSGEQWEVICEQWKKKLVTRPVVSYNRGLKDIILASSVKKIGEDKQHEHSIVSGEQQKTTICTQLLAYIFIIYKIP